MSNPYSAPQPGDNTGGSYSAAVQQVRVVAILMIIHGVLCLLMSLFYIGYGIFFPQLMEIAREGNPNQPEMPFNIVWVFYGMGIPAAISGIVQVVAGIRNFMFHGHMLGLIASVMCLLSVSTVYCGLTAVALAVYGLVIFLNENVRAAFAMRADGRSVPEVLSRFSYAAPPIPRA